VSQLAYRAALPLLRAYRFVARPRVRSVRCVLEHEGSVLLVRHTYGDRRWSFPGGLAKGSESPYETARREIREELGVDGVRWRRVGRVQSSNSARHVVTCLAGRLASRAVHAKPAEIAEIAWIPLDDLPDDKLDGTAAIASLMRGGAVFSPSASESPPSCPSPP
jgi:8-oxo-dGTP pyrophosphatase MutT (NUDIX family)